MPHPNERRAADRCGETCNVALFHGAGHALEFQQFPLPKVVAGEALVRVDCCTICGSDLHTITGARTERVPSILGHEILGTVDEVGDPPLCDIDGRALQSGDRVTWSTCVSCGQCDRCLRGIPQKCRQLAKYGHEVAIGRYALSGGLAECILLRPGTVVVRVGQEVPDEVICPANCATATVAAAFRASGSIADRRVLILGAGLLGLTAAAFAKSHQASQVVVCDLDPHRLRLAERFGADGAVAWHDERDELRRRLSEVSGAESFDVVLEVSGSPEAVEAACDLGAIGGRIILVGTVMGSRSVCLDPEQIVRRLLSIHGVHNYAPDDLRTAVEFLTQFHNVFPFAELVEQTYTLASVNEAIEHALRSRPVRIAARP